MSFNLLDLVKDQVTGQLVKQASGMLGESEGGISKALGGIFPSILGSVINKGSSEEGASGLLDMIKGVDPSILGNIGGLLGGGAEEKGGLMEMGGGLLSGLLGNKLGGAVDLISKFGGIKSGSAMSLFKMAAPLLMGLIGKKVASSNMGASGLMSMLADQKDSVRDAMPAGMGGIMGLGDLLGSAKDLVSGAATVGTNAVKGAASAATGAASSAAGAAASAATATAATAKKTGSSLFKWLIPALLVLAAAYFLSTKMCAGTTVGDKVGSVLEDGMDATKKAGSMVVDGAKTAGDAIVDGAETAGGAIADGATAVGKGLSGAFNTVNEAGKKALSTITFTAGSAGKQMMDYIEGGGKEGNGTFRFNNLNFESNRAAISGTSGVEVDNLAAILKAYTGVNVVIEGHTDSDGADDANMALSKARAEAVKARLVTKGVAASRIETKGYGETMPIGSNDTAEGKASNRRIEVKVAN